MQVALVSFRWASCIERNGVSAAPRKRAMPLVGTEYLISGGPCTVFGTLICGDNNLTENIRATALPGPDPVLASHQSGDCRTRELRFGAE